MSARFIRCKAPTDVLIVSKKTYEAIKNGGFETGCSHKHLVLIGPAKFRAAAVQP